jgi:branched-chain amino acid aminotransferase
LYAETDYVRAVNGGTGEAKAAGNYAGALLPAKMSQDRGFDQVLWLDAKEFRYIQESGTMNIFFVLDGKVITPPLNGSILHGITRRSVIELLRREGHIVEEYAITIDEVLEAHRNGTLQEAFGTGTAAVVSQVEAIAYQDKLIELPPASQQPIGKFAKKIIDELRAGTIPDPYGWVVPVSGPEENR